MAGNGKVIDKTSNKKTKKKQKQRKRDEKKRNEKIPQTRRLHSHWHKRLVIGGKFDEF